MNVIYSSICFSFSLFNAILAYLGVFVLDKETSVIPYGVNIYIFFSLISFIYGVINLKK